MRHEKIVPGTILISLGIIFLLQSFDVIDIDFWNVLSLWPMFIVIAGINLIFAHNRTVWASALKVGVILLGFAILIFGKFDNDNRRWNNWPHFSFHNRHNDRVDVVKIDGNSTFNEPFHDDVKIAKLNISGGASRFILSDTTNQLFQAYTKEVSGSYEFKHSNSDSVYTLDFSMKDFKKYNFNSKKYNTVAFKLNTAPIWDIDLGAGAVDAELDLSKFKIRSLDVNSGMSAFRLKLGMPLETTKVDVQTGMANIRISIPKDAACKITNDSGLTSKHFEGFNKNADDDYETPGYANAKNKIIINFDGAMSDFTVTRY